MNKIMFTSLLIYISIVISIMQNWLILAAILVSLFSIKYGAVTLIPLAMLIDGYYGNYHAVPVLSIVAVGWFVLVEYLRPRFANFYSQ